MNTLRRDTHMSRCGRREERQYATTRVNKIVHDLRDHLSHILDEDVVLDSVDKVNDCFGTLTVDKIKGDEDVLLVVVHTCRIIKQLTTSSLYTTEMNHNCWMKKYKDIFKRWKNILQENKQRVTHHKLKYFLITLSDQLDENNR